jgi:integrase
MARNSPGQGTIKARTLANGDIVFDAWVTVTDPATLKPTKLAKRNAGSTKREAQAWISKQVADSENGLRALVVRGWTVRACWDAWRSVTHLKDSTVLEYERVLNALTRDMWDLPIGAVTQLRFDSMIKSMRAKGIPTTRLVHLVESWVHIFEGAISVQAVQYNAAHKSPWRLKLVNDMANEKEARDTEKRDEGYIEVITTAQYHDLLATESRETMRNVWELIGQTGLRRSEVLALEWKDIDLSLGVIRVRRGVADIGGKLVHLDTPKGNRSRRIYIDAETIDLLFRMRKLVDEYRAHWGDRWEDHDLVCPLMDIRTTNENPPGHWMLPSNLSQTYLRRAKKLGFSSTKLHGLRFRWATMAFDAGVDPRDIQEHMGHKNLDVTMFTYVKRTEERKREAVAMAGKAIRGELYIGSDEQLALSE